MLSFQTATICLYAGALGLYAWLLRESKPWLGPAASLAFAAGVALHYFALLDRAHASHTVPYQDLAGSMSLFGWLLAVTYLGLEAFHRQRAVGAFVLPFVLLLMMATTLMPATAPASAPAQGPLFALHVTLNILAYSAFALAFVLSLIYFLQARLLRKRHLGQAFWKFPALELLDRMSWSSVLVGVVSLCVGISLGFVWAHRLRGRYVTGDPKEIISVLMLGVYGGYLWLGRTAAWRGTRASILCILSFALVLFSYTVVNVYLSGFHRYF